MTMDNPTFSGNLFDLTGKVAVISGAAQGLGKAASLAVAQAGANVVLVDRNISGLETTADLIRKTGRKALVSVTNVSDPDAIAELFKQIDLEFGRVDFLGN
ncbi:MAG: SDR family NAD(P)-dependent oxidoreductase, partial [Gemmataceae bacterium]